MNELFDAIDNCIIAIGDFKNKYQLESNGWPIDAIERVLNLLKNRFKDSPDIDVRLLRAMKDVYVMSFRNYDGTFLMDAINRVDDELAKVFTVYINLEPLGMDFGKGNPI